MAQTQSSKAPTVTSCVVLRAICMHGERVEVGTVIEMTIAQYNESFSAGKVGPPPPVKKSKPVKDET